MKGVDLMGKRIKPEGATLTVVLPEDVHRPPRLHRLILIHCPQACQCVDKGVTVTRYTYTLRRTPHALQHLAGRATGRRLQEHSEIAGEISGELEELSPVACREVVVLLVGSRDQRRHLIQNGSIQHPEWQRPHAAAAGGLQGRLLRDRNCSVVAWQVPFGAAGKDLDLPPQVFRTEPAIQPHMHELPRTRGHVRMWLSPRHST